MDHSRSSSKTCGCALRSFSADWHTGTTWVIQQQVRDLNSTWTVDHPISSQSTGGYWFDSGAVRPSISSGVRQALHRVRVFSLSSHSVAVRAKPMPRSRVCKSQIRLAFIAENDTDSVHTKLPKIVYPAKPTRLATSRAHDCLSGLHVLLFTRFVRASRPAGLPLTRRPLCSSYRRSFGHCPRARMQ